MLGWRLGLKRIKIGTTTEMTNGPSTPRITLRFLEEVLYALVASDGQASLRRSISETDLLVSEEEVNQTFACWKKDLVGVTGLLWTNCFWPTCTTMGGDTEQYFFEELVAGFEESERKTSDVCRGVFARARSIFPCAATT